MTRFRADLLLVLTAIIWGTAFVAQKALVSGIGPFGFAGARFILSFVVIIPFILRESRMAGALTRRDILGAGLVSLVFTASVILQQMGIAETTVTNAGFLTGLYVMIVPFMAWIFFRRPPSRLVWLASLMAIAGVWLLNGASLTTFGRGDWLVIACSVGFAVQMVMLGVLVKRTGRPMALSAFQYAAVALVGLGAGFGFEGLSFSILQANVMQIAYAGIISGGIAYTLQAVAQQYTQAADAGVILSGEALFAAMTGAWLLGDRLTLMGWSGCALIFTAMIMVEAGAFLSSRQKAGR
jgi:drug/metabolite transporter (DMT)-like permease